MSENNKGNLISCNKISLSYENKTVLSGISFDIKRNEIVTIIGPNGSGKTSLLRVICGLENACAGVVTKADGLAVGYMPQKFHIDRVLPLTVRRFLRISGKGRGLRNIDEIEEIADKMGILHLKDQQVHDISGGEMQRVMLTRALLRNPDLLVLDEPTQGLDIQGQAEFYNILTKIRDEKGCGIIMVSHDLHMVMAATDRVLCLNGHICCAGKPEDVSKHPEYISLFGKQSAKEIAIYMHKHDHTHDIDGCVHEDGGG